MSNSHTHAGAASQSDETSTVRALRLHSWSRLNVSGEDSESFLQGQLSADLRRLRPGQARWATYNSPKGRMLAVMQMHRTEHAIELWMPPALVDTVARRLRMFVLRAKVLIEAPAHQPSDPSVAAHDRLALIQAGVPVIYPETQDRWVAQMANLDLIGGISFDKGCYTGQEVVARLHYLGNLKKRMFLVRGDGPPPAPGTAIRDAQGDGQAVGEIVDAVTQDTGFVATAVLQLAIAESAQLVLDRADHAALARPQAFAYRAAS
ncbi:MAG: CAF17-like 4Fe-4S cluster assembly/insertion protein YgfZ [Panacagrimonas sp.]